jgi:hypothetical protein
MLARLTCGLMMVVLGLSGCETLYGPDDKEPMPRPPPGQRGYRPPPIRDDYDRRRQPPPPKPQPPQAQTQAPAPPPLIFPPPRNPAPRVDPVDPTVPEPPIPPGESTPIVIVGLSQGDVLKTLGEPAQRTERNPGQSWVWRTDGCSLEVLFLLDVVRNDLYAIDRKVNGTDGTPMGEQLCLQRIKSGHGS